MANVLRGLAVMLTALMLSACATGGPPSHQRDWDDLHKALPTVSWSSKTAFTIRNVRDWSWNADRPVRKRWRTETHDLRNVRAIWFFVEPLSFATKLAHTFITFEMERGGRPAFLSVSVEARREVGETYSPTKGLFGAYELIFAWSSEKDILVDTGYRLGHDLRMYRVNVTPAQAEVILRGFLDRTNEIARTPEFYDTLTHNCTSELAAVVNREFERSIPQSSATVLTGTAARYLHSLGYLGDPDESFAAVDARAGIREAVVRHRTLPEVGFSVAVRREVGAR
jgi:hypothetical protein